MLNQKELRKIAFRKFLEEKIFRFEIAQKINYKQFFFLSESSSLCFAGNELHFFHNFTDMEERCVRSDKA